MMQSLITIIEQTLLHLPLMFGAYISFSLLKVPDLSIESAYVFGALVSTQFIGIIQGSSPYLQLSLALAAGLFGGACVGLVSSLLTQKARLPHLLSAILTFGLFHGINQLIAKAYISLSGYQNLLSMIPLYAKAPELVILLILGAVITIMIMALFKTQLGYAYAVYGNNPLFFKNYGISTSYVFITGILIANALSGLSGYLFAQSNNFAEYNMGIGKALLCITALILGKVIIKPQQFSISVPLVGTLAYFSLQQTLLKVGFDLKYFTAMQAAIILIILVYTYHNKPGTITDNLGV